MQVMKVDYMSFEHPMSESDEDNSNHRDGYESPDFERPKKKVFCISTLHWCNSDLTQVMHSLDKKATRRGSVTFPIQNYFWRRNSGYVTVQVFILTPNTH